jgi:hypothetical protein
MEGWYDEWKRKFFSRECGASRRKPGTSIEGLEALRQDVWEIAHPGETRAAGGRGSGSQEAQTAPYQERRETPLSEMTGRTQRPPRDLLDHHPPLQMELGSLPDCCELAKRNLGRQRRR